MNNKNNPINSYNILSRLPDIRPVHSLIIIFNLALIIGGLVCEIIFYGTENFAGVIASGIIAGSNLLCFLILKNVINWYPQARFEIYNEYIDFSYFVPGIDKMTDYKVEQIDHIKETFDGLTVTGIIKHKPAAKLNYEALDKYKFYIANKELKNKILLELQEFKKRQYINELNNCLADKPEEKNNDSNNIDIVTESTEMPDLEQNIKMVKDEMAKKLNDSDRMDITIDKPNIKVTTSTK